MAWCFTLRSFAQMYADSFGSLSHLSFQSKLSNLATGSLDVKGFADRLWGDIFFDNEKRKFTRKQTDPEQNRTFVHFIMEPLYKLYSQVVSEETDNLRETLDSLKIKLKPIMFKMDVRPLLKAVLDQFFGPSTGLVDMIVEHLPSPMENSANKVTFSFIGQCFKFIVSTGRTHVFRSSDIENCNCNASVRLERPSHGPHHEVVPYCRCPKFPCIRSSNERCREEGHGDQSSWRRLFTRGRGGHDACCSG